MEYTPDAIDRRIMHLLQLDGKTKIKEIASALKMTNTPVFERIKRLERLGFILGYSTIVDKEKLGFKLVAFCSVTLESHDKQFLNQFIVDVQKLPEVMECYHIAGLFDYLLKVYCKDMKDYQQFVTEKLAGIPNIGRVQSFFVMTEIKHEKTLPFS